MPVEAMAAGAPVVAQAVGGTAESVVPGLTGALSTFTSRASMKEGVACALATRRADRCRHAGSFSAPNASATRSAPGSGPRDEYGHPGAGGGEPELRHAAGHRPAALRRRDQPAAVGVGAGSPPSAPSGFWARSTWRVWAWVQLVLPWLTRGAMLLSMTSRAPWWCRRQVVVVHDLFVLTNPGWFSRLYYLTHAPLLRAQIRSAAAVVAVSQPTADELASIYSGPIVVAPNAPSATFSPDGRRRDGGAGPARRARRPLLAGRRQPRSAQEPAAAGRGVRALERRRAAAPPAGRRGRRQRDLPQRGPDLAGRRWWTPAT